MKALDRNPAAEGAAADAIVAALRSALRGRLDWAARKVLRGFESSRGRPAVPVDGNRVQMVPWQSTRASSGTAVAGSPIRRSVPASSIGSQPGRPLARGTAVTL